MCHALRVRVLALLAGIHRNPARHGWRIAVQPGRTIAKRSAQQDAHSYYCTAQGNGESKWYVTGLEPAPNFGTPQYQTFQADSSVAFTEYMNATYGRNRALYAHCMAGPSESLRPGWEQMQHDPRFKETVHVNWRYGQLAAPAM